GNLDWKGDSMSIVTPTIPQADSKTRALIDKIVEVYGPLRGTQLSYLTHLEGTAWSMTKNEGAVIPNDLMAQTIK
ncbi:MAG: hypothetical protein E6559_24085, partial [Pantoea sp.]|nr:hypothetical protein [Pantoea sp.]